MADESDLVSDSWRTDQDIMRRNAAPADPAAMNVDELILFLDQALRLAGNVPSSPRPAIDYPRAMI